LSENSVSFEFSVIFGMKVDSNRIITIKHTTVNFLFLIDFDDIFENKLIPSLKVIFINIYHFIKVLLAVIKY
ncbi:MAG: hypothetical protein ACYTBZ_11840, partial [Planctomycetota bacterium]